MKRPVREVDVEVVPPATGAAGRTHRIPTSGEDPMIAFMARLMDTVFEIPGTKIRFGLDPILGMIPGLGDTISGLVSAFLIAQSARYGVPKIVLARMAGNALLNTAVGSVPVVGDLFSVWFKSNAKNYDLLRRHAGSQERGKPGDWWFVIGLLAVFFVIFVLLLVGAWTLMSVLFSYATG